MKTTQIVDGIILNENKILLLKRSSNKRFLPGNWDLPGGKVEQNELLEAAIKREILEETSLIVYQATPKYTWNYTIPDRPDQRFKVTNYLIECSKYEPVIVKKEEHSEYNWFTLKEIEKLQNFSAQMKIAIKKTLED